MKLELKHYAPPCTHQLQFKAPHSSDSPLKKAYATAFNMTVNVILRHSSLWFLSFFLSTVSCMRLETFHLNLAFKASIKTLSEAVLDLREFCIWHVGSRRKKVVQRGKR